MLSVTNVDPILDRISLGFDIEKQIEGIDDDGQLSNNDFYYDSTGGNSEIISANASYNIDGGSISIDGRRSVGNDGEVSYNYGAKTRFTLYRGNAFNVNAIINSTLEESYSDESGFFQIYGYIGDNLTVTKEGGTKRTAQIDQNLESDENGMLFVDSVICK